MYISCRVLENVGAPASSLRHDRAHEGFIWPMKSLKFESFTGMGQLAPGTDRKTTNPSRRLSDLPADLSGLIEKEDDGRWGMSPVKESLLPVE